MESSAALERIKSNPTSRSIYRALLARLDRVGPYGVEGKKTSLHITNGRAFLGVHPRKDGLMLNIVLGQPVKGPRVRKSERVSANRYHNEILLAAAGDVDDQIGGLLERAYALASERR